MKKIYKISQTGNVEGLWDDLLTDIGEPKIKRASEVEYSNEAGGWTVKILVGLFAGCYLPKAYKKRKEALESEVVFLNQELLEGRLTY